MAKKAVKQQKQVKNKKITKKQPPPKQTDQLKRPTRSNSKIAQLKKPLPPSKNKTQIEKKPQLKATSKVKPITQKKSKLVVPVLKFFKQKREKKNNKKSPQDQEDSQMELVHLTLSEDEQKSNVNQTKGDKKEKKINKKSEKQKIDTKKKTKLKEKSVQKIETGKDKPISQRQKRNTKRAQKQQSNITEELSRKTNKDPIISKGKPQTQDKSNTVQKGIGKRKQQKIKSSQQKKQQEQKPSFKPEKLSQKNQQVLQKDKKLEKQEPKNDDKPNTRKKQPKEKVLKKKENTTNIPSIKSQANQEKTSKKQKSSLKIENQSKSDKKAHPKPQKQKATHKNNKQKEHKISIEGISTNSFQGDIRQLFRDCGYIVNVKFANKNKQRFAYVQFLSRDSLEKALLKTGIEHMNKTLTIIEAVDSENESSSGQQSSSESQPQEENQIQKEKVQKTSKQQKQEEEKVNDSRHELQKIESQHEKEYVKTPNLIIHNLAECVTYQQFNNLCSEYGKVVSCRIDQKDDGICGVIVANVQYETLEMAQQALDKLKDRKIYGKDIKVDIKKVEKIQKEIGMRKQTKSTNLALTLGDKKSKALFRRVF